MKVSRSCQTKIVAAEKVGVCIFFMFMRNLYYGLMLSKKITQKIGGNTEEGGGGRRVKA